MSDHGYQDPVSKLLDYGQASPGDWPDYLSLGFTAEHIPDLIHLATDPNLLIIDSDDADKWAPIHAWRALGQLRAESAIEPIIALWDIDPQLDADLDDWTHEELPEVFALIGPAAVPALFAYLAEVDKETFARVSAMTALKSIAEKYPENWAAIVAPLILELARPEQDDDIVNAFIISALVDLKANEAAAVIKAAFYVDKVNPTILGDWYDVYGQLNLDPSIEVPGPEPAHMETRPFFSPLSLLNDSEYLPGYSIPKKASKQSKKKRKQEQKSRKINRKKK